MDVATAREGDRGTLPNAAAHSGSGAVSFTQKRGVVFIKRFYLKPFEAFIGLFVIVNGILTLMPGGTGSSVKENLWNLLGVGGMILPYFQIAAGSFKIVGIAIGKSNIEAAGLVMVTCMFIIRAIMLVADGDISAADINNEVIAMGIIVSNVIRFIQIINGKKYMLAEIREAQPTE